MLLLITCQEKTWGDPHENRRSGNKWDPVGSRDFFEVWSTTGWFDDKIKGGKKKMVEIKETKGTVKIKVCVNEDNEYRRTDIIIGHTVKVDVNGELVIFKNSMTVPATTANLDISALKDEIVNKLESTLSLANHRAENLIKILDELGKLSDELDVEFEVEVERDY